MYVEYNKKNKENEKQQKNEIKGEMFPYSLWSITVLYTH